MMNLFSGWQIFREVRMMKCLEHPNIGMSSYLLRNKFDRAF